MEIKILQEDLTKNLQEAILNSFTDEAKKHFITEAIKSLTEKTKFKPYGSFKEEERPSKLEDIFSSEITKIAREQVRDLLENDENIKKTVRDFVSNALMKSLQEDALVNSFARCLGNAFSE